MEYLLLIALVALVAVPCFSRLQRSLSDAADRAGATLPHFDAGDRGAQDNGAVREYGRPESQPDRKPDAPVPAGEFQANTAFSLKSDVLFCLTPGGLIVCPEVPPVPATTTRAPGLTIPDPGTPVPVWPEATPTATATPSPTPEQHCELEANPPDPPSPSGDPSAAEPTSSPTSSPASTPTISAPPSPSVSANCTPAQRQIREDPLEDERERHELLRARSKAFAQERENPRADGEEIEKRPGTVGVLTPDTPEHKAQRWREYLERGGTWLYDRWSKVYDENMGRAKAAAAAADRYQALLGWGKREVTVDVEGIPRRLDIADKATQRGVEVKIGDQYADQENLWEVERDRILREQGWDIRWHFEGHASEPLKKALDDAGVPYDIVPKGLR